MGARVSGACSRHGRTKPPFGRKFGASERKLGKSVQWQQRSSPRPLHGAKTALQCNKQNKKEGARQNYGTTDAATAPGRSRLGPESLSHSLPSHKNSLARGLRALRPSSSVTIWGVRCHLQLRGSATFPVDHFRHTETPLSAENRSKQNGLSSGHDFELDGPRNIV
jgi:hypothetical protein